MRGFRHAFPVLFQIPVATHAAERFADPGVGANTGLTGGVAQSLLALLLVLGVLFAVTWAVRRFRMVGQGGGNNLRVIQGISLGAKERAVLVQVNGRRLLLGVAPGQVTLLTELSGDDASPVAPTETASMQNPDFKAILKRSLGLQDKSP